MRRRTTDLAAHRSHNHASPSPFAHATDFTVGGFLDGIARDAGAAWATCRSLIASIAARTEWHHERRDDLVQEIMVRMLEGDLSLLRRADPTAPLAAWLNHVARHLRLEAARCECRRGIAHARAARGEAMDDEDCRVDQIDGADLLDRARRILPSPFREIVDWRWSMQRSRAEIAAALRSWGGVGPDEARRLQREADRMLRFIAIGGDPRRVWPRRYAKKNRWEYAPGGVPGSHLGEQDECRAGG